jgi:hypothetical protein
MKIVERQSILGETSEVWFYKRESAYSTWPGRPYRPDDAAIAAALMEAERVEWHPRGDLSQLISQGGGTKTTVFWWRAMLAIIAVLCTVAFSISFMMVVGWVQIRRKCHKNQIRLASGVCPHCKYQVDLKMHRCPECGLHFAAYLEATSAKLAKRWFRFDA